MRPRAIAISAEGLTKTYGATLALDRLSFEIPAGTVTGFLGPNGAGKTTTFRALLGLTRLDAGTATIGGRSLASDLAVIVKHVGAIIDEPGLLRPLSGRHNLVVAAHTLGFGHDRIDDLVEFVELVDHIDRPVSGYSKGMRQRLALAAAMIGDPEVLLLDEPLDGLDPAGQHAFRTRLRQLADEEGRTVVVSSHNLSDVQALADHVVVVARGSLRFQGPLEELIGGVTGVRVTVADLAGGGEVLAAAGFEVEVDADSIRVVTEDGSAVSRVLAEAGMFPSALVPAGGNLEAAFLGLTGDGT